MFVTHLHVHMQFPVIYEEPVIRHVHHSTHKLDDLSGRIAAHFRDSFVCGEEVLGTKDGMPTPCRVVAVHEAPAVEGEHTRLYLLCSMSCMQVNMHGVKHGMPASHRMVAMHESPAV